MPATASAVRSFSGDCGGARRVAISILTVTLSYSVLPGSISFLVTLGNLYLTCLTSFPTLLYFSYFVKYESMYFVFSVVLSLQIQFSRTLFIKTTSLIQYKGINIGKMIAHIGRRPNFQPFFSHNRDTFHDSSQ